MEEWRDIQGYEGLYQVSNKGRVKSLDRVVYKYNPFIGENTPTHYKGKILKQHTSVHYGKERCQTILSKNGEKTEPITARLVYEAFIGEIPDGMQVNHIDENPSNNAISNLNLMTPKENTNFGTCIKRRAETFKNNGKMSQPIIQIDPKTNEVIATYPSTREASRQTSFKQSNIARACNGGFNYKGKWINVIQSNGFIWKKIPNQP